MSTFGVGVVGVCRNDAKEKPMDNKFIELTEDEFDSQYTSSPIT